MRISDKDGLPIPAAPTSPLRVQVESSNPPAGVLMPRDAVQQEGCMAPSDHANGQAILERIYSLWEHAGRPEGRSFIPPISGGAQMTGLRKRRKPSL